MLRLPLRGGSVWTFHSECRKLGTSRVFSALCLYGWKPAKANGGGGAFAEIIKRAPLQTLALEANLNFHH